VKKLPARDIVRKVIDDLLAQPRFRKAWDGAPQAEKKAIRRSLIAVVTNELEKLKECDQ
jgi:hypothetical protein